MRLEQVLCLGPMISAQRGKAAQEALTHFSLNQEQEQARRLMVSSSSALFESSSLKKDVVGHAVNQKKEPVHRLKKEFPTNDAEGDSESDEEMEEVRKREQMEMMRLIRERQALFFPQSQAGDLVQDRRLESVGDSEASQKKPQVSFPRPHTYISVTLRCICEKEVACHVNLSLNSARYVHNLARTRRNLQQNHAALAGVSTAV